MQRKKRKNTTHQKEETESRQLFRYGWLDSGAINGMAERSRGIGAEGVEEVEVEVEVGWEWNARSDVADGSYPSIVLVDARIEDGFKSKRRTCG